MPWLSYLKIFTFLFLVLIKNFSHFCFPFKFFQPTGFSAIEIRQAFLGFFVSIFQNYKEYIDKDGFRSNDFLAHGLNSISNNALQYMEQIIKTQMFQSFVDERYNCPNDAEVMFFDDSIAAKLNRSTKNAITNISLGRTVKKQTTFLNDTTYRVRKKKLLPQLRNYFIL